ncbi:cytochrome c-type biogenesis protein [Asticcacaulis sp.]|uniref:cytochrome c-type biogenesis protein n=1 Tax=Asticcacaulis sp. TaxID=1872648 RepID=UPI002B520FCB|nr:cytochrome c-type biogenesis protein [Asticcacaulis sp.]HTM79673.1 cytochrome c-type biogenesis protein [Asticcacaulis sp.]
MKLEPRMHTNRHEYLGLPAGWIHVLRSIEKTIRVYSCLFAVLLLPLHAFAATPQDEARARQLFTEVRCVQCQSESIADSDAQIAGDMRREIRADIAGGKTDAQIRKELFAHYGDYVLFRPRFSLGNLLLWLLPPLIALIGGVILWRSRRKPAESTDYVLSDDEEKKLRVLLKKRD